MTARRLLTGFAAAAPIAAIIFVLCRSGEQPKPSDEPARLPTPASHAVPELSVRTRPDPSWSAVDGGIDPDIRIDGLQVAPLIPGAKPGPVALRGRFRYDGSEPALPSVILRVLQKAAGAGDPPEFRGAWLRRDVIAVPAGGWIPFRVPLTAPSATLMQVEAAACNPRLTAERTSDWVPLKAGPARFASTAPGGRAILEGGAVNPGPRVVFAYRVAADLFDRADHLLDTVVGEYEYTGTGEPWGEGAELPFALDTAGRGFDRSAVARVSVRAVGRVR